MSIDAATDRRHLILGTLALGLSGGLAAGLADGAAAQTPPPALAGRPPADPVETIDLWPRGAPGMPRERPIETVEERSRDQAWPDRAVRGITRPRLVVFRPKKANGAAILITPGGAYLHVVIDKEGYELGRWLSERGFTVFVLFYRLPGEGWTAGADVALSDAQRAMRVIRSRAGRYGIDPGRVAAMGFSAGGHLCADLVARFATRTYAPIDAADRLSARPAIAAPIYPVISMSAPDAHPQSRELLVGKLAPPAVEHAHSPHLNITRNAPPCFLVHAEDDMTVPVENTLLLRAALKANGVRVETHLFEQGGHGFGLHRAAGKPIAAWPDLFVAWAHSLAFV